MGYTTDLLTGLAVLMDGGGLGVYRASGVYAAGETGITIAKVPEAPDRIICLTPYPVEDTGGTDVITGVQIRMRAGPDPREVLDLADVVRDLLHGRENFYLGPVRVALAWRQSQGLMGQDAHSREELSANYYLRTSRSAPYVHE
ncbi:minor capsid protein [Streptomyces odonnellii]|uniref:minor capsid protein n=1 Tax=Streptomyces odonnellii TaxID=1417980 RepID=UPI000A4F54E3|nr:minor capsid protein [Streptomyces odonnellii]